MLCNRETHFLALRCITFITTVIRFVTMPIMVINSIAENPCRRLMRNYNNQRIYSCLDSVCLVDDAGLGPTAVSTVNQKKQANTMTDQIMFTVMKTAFSTANTLLRSVQSQACYASIYLLTGNFYGRASGNWYKNGKWKYGNRHTEVRKKLPAIGVQCLTDPRLCFVTIG